MRRLGDCELCGAMNVGTNRVSYHKSNIEACVRCCEKMNLSPLRTRESIRSRSVGKKKSNYKPKLTTSKSLVDNFSKKISMGRSEKNLSKNDLAKKANVRLIDIQNIESGKILEDKVVQNIERDKSLKLLAIGIGHDVSKYYRNAFTIDDVNKLAEVLIDKLVSIIKEVQSI